MSYTDNYLMSKKDDVQFQSLWNEYKHLVFQHINEMMEFGATSYEAEKRSIDIFQDLLLYGDLKKYYNCEFDMTEEKAMSLITPEDPMGIVSASEYEKEQAQFEDSMIYDEDSSKEEDGFWVFKEVHKEVDGMICVPKETYGRIVDALLGIASSGVINKNYAPECYDLTVYHSNCARWALGWTKRDTE